MNFAEERRLNSPDLVDASRQAQRKKQLKTDVKAATAFVKRVAVISEETAPQLVKDVTTGDKTNLGRFVEEIVAALAKAPIKMKDIPACTQFVSAMHRQYEDFLDPLVQNLVEQYDACFKTDNSSKVDIPRRRLLLRWFGELYVSGLLPDQLFLKQLRAATRHGSAPGPLPEKETAPLPDQALGNLNGINLLIKQLGSELVRGSTDEDFPPIRARISVLLENYVAQCVVRLDLECGALKRLHSKADTEQLRRGIAPSAEQAELMERRERIVEEVYAFCLTACELLQIPAPPAPNYREDLDEAKLAREEQGLELWNRKKAEGGELTLDAWVFGDETARSFYQDLEDLQSLVPRMILDRPDQALQPDPLLLCPTTEMLALDSEASAAAAAGADEAEGETLVVEEEEEENAGEGVAPSSVESVARPVEELMARLPSMLSVRAVESFARDFAHVNSKSARKRVVQELFNVPWGRSELIPYYARLATVLSNAYVGIGKLLCDSVRSAFYRAARDRRRGSRMSSRARHAKYLGELVKFGLRFPNLQCPPAAAFIALKQCLATFQGENIDMACILLETCGRELYRFPRTHMEMVRLLEIVVRHKQNKLMTPAQDAMIENACFHCNPPAAQELKKRARRERGPIEVYVRHLLLNKLGAFQLESPGETRAAALKRQSNQVLRALLTLPWTTEYSACQEAIRYAFLASCKSRAGSLPLVCLAVSQLASVYPNVAICIVDALLEAICLGLESNEPRLNQRRIGQARCLGYMLRQGLIKDDVFFDTLFAMLHWGHEKPSAGGSTSPLLQQCSMANASRYHPNVPCLPNDPPYDAFRVRLVCAALEAAGDSAVNTPKTFARLDLFLLYLERYVWNKSYFALEVEFVLLDTLQALERLYVQVRQKRGLREAGLCKYKNNTRSNKLRAVEHELSKLDASGATARVQLVGRSANLQAAEDAVARAEGRGFEFSVLSAATTIEEEEEQEEEEGEEEDAEEEEEVEGDEDVVEEDGEEAPVIAGKGLLPVKEEREPSAEDLAFEHEFAKLMKETVEQSGKANLSGTAAARGDNLSIPLGLVKKTAPSSSTVATAAPMTTLHLVKRSAGKKFEVRDLQVPSTIILAKASSTSKDKLEREEQEAMKRLTLATTSRMREGGEFT